MASVERLVSGRWQARWRDPEGVQRKQSFARKAHADQFLIGVGHGILSGGYVDPLVGRQPFKAYAEGWRAGQPHRPGTAAAAEQHLRVHAYPALGARPIAAVRPSEVQAWVTGLPVAASTARTVFKTVRAVFRAAVRDRIVALSPCDAVVLPKVEQKKVEPLTVAQVQALIAAVRPEYRALLVLAAGSGLRAGELFGLEVRHVDFLRRTVTVEQQVQAWTGHGARVCPPKTAASYRMVPLPQVVLDALAEHLASGKPVSEADGFLFTAPSGGPVIRTSFMKSVWTVAARASGLPKGTGLHSMRHFYASALIRGGLSVRVVSERLGHANAAMTLNVYSHLWPDDEDRTRQALEELLGTSRAPNVPRTGLRSV